MIKFRLYYDKDAETKWLNEMAAEGWAMTGFFAGFYKFEQCEKGKYTYQVDFGDHFCRVSDEYRELIQDTGAEIVQTWGYWIILRKLASEGEFELYTDVDSTIEHYTKIRRMFKVVTILELLILFIELLSLTQSDSPGLIIGCCFVIGAIIIACVRASVRTNYMICELKERQTGIPQGKGRDVSALLPVGLLINGCALCIAEYVSSYIRNTVQIIAIVFMLWGIYLTARKRNG